MIISPAVRETPRGRFDQVNRRDECIDYSIES